MQDRDPRELLWNWDLESELDSKKSMLNKFVGDHYSSTNGLEEIVNNKKHEANRVIQILNLNNQKTVIDFGSGPGYIAFHVAQNVKKLYCIDVSQSFLDEASNYNQSLHNIDYIKVNFSDFNKVPHVDSIYCLALFIHFTLYDIFSHLSGMFDCLNSGGELFFDILSDEYIDFQSKKWINGVKKSIVKPESNFTNVKYNNKIVVKQMAQHIGFNIIDMFDDTTHSFFHVVKT